MKTSNPKEVTNNCEFCKNEFQVTWQYRKQRFCSVKCKCDWIKSNHWEESNCLHCHKKFKRYKNYIHPRTKKKTMFCSNDCNRKSDYKKEKLREWGKSNKNHWKNNRCGKQIGKTKLERYGDSNYNNMEKNKKTMLENHGVPYAFWTGKRSNGKRISKPQRALYEEIKKYFPDALLEEWLTDVQMSVDIYIPSIKKVVEFYGDYWHCNPKLCSPTYYNSQVHMTAKEIWKKDKNRQKLLKNAGYDVEVVWENSNKKLKSDLSSLVDKECL